MSCVIQRRYNESASSPPSMIGFLSSKKPRSPGPGEGLLDPCPELVAQEYQAQCWQTRQSACFRHFMSHRPREKGSALNSSIRSSTLLIVFRRHLPSSNFMPYRCHLEMKSQKGQTHMEIQFPGACPCHNRSPGATPKACFASEAEIRLPVRPCTTRSRRCSDCCFVVLLRGSTSSNR